MQVNPGRRGNYQRLSPERKKNIYIKVLCILVLSMGLIYIFYFAEDAINNYGSLDEYNSQYSEHQQLYQAYLNLTHLYHLKENSQGSADNSTLEPSYFSNITEDQYEELFKLVNTLRVHLNISINDLEGGYFNNATYNWTSYLPPVKDQGICDAGYAFAAVAALEAQVSMTSQNNQTVEFSEQQIIDCCLECSGCESNETTVNHDIVGALNYMKKYGLLTAKEYPYTGVKGECKTNGREGVKIASYKKGTKIGTLLEELARGPVIATVDTRNWYFYSDGVMTNCGKRIDHHVLLVAKTLEEFTIRNSKSRKWGKKGYLTMQAGATCGVSKATYMISLK